MSVCIEPIAPAEKGELTKLYCPRCSERVRGVALLKGSTVDGLTFTCKRCRIVYGVKTK